MKDLAAFESRGVVYDGVQTKKSVQHKDFATCIEKSRSQLMTDIGDVWEKINSLKEMRKSTNFDGMLAKTCKKKSFFTTKDGQTFDSSGEKYVRASRIRMPRRRRRRKSHLSCKDHLLRNMLQKIGVRQRNRHQQVLTIRDHYDYRLMCCQCDECTYYNDLDPFVVNMEFLTLLLAMIVVRSQFQCQDVVAMDFLRPILAMSVC
jgi:hypothetical protein